MKRAIYTVLFGAAIITASISCDRVERPNVPKGQFDESLYPGDFDEYVPPTFDPNTNVNKNVLLEDWTGHQCTFCPGAAAEAAAIEDANPGRVFVATIHAGADFDGISSFQETNASGKFTRDFTTPEGTEMAATFFSQTEFGFGGNPLGSFNRIKDSDGTIFNASSSTWEDRVNEALATPLQVNLQAKSSYFPSTNGVFLHVETEFLENLEGDFNIVIYAIEDKIIDWQKQFGVGDIEDYEHHNVHIGNVYGETWGQVVTAGPVSEGQGVASGSISAGTKIVSDFSYEVPAHLNNTTMHFQIFVFNRETYEVMQVIEHHF